MVHEQSFITKIPDKDAAQRKKLLIPDRIDVVFTTE